jgi:O-antigen/teichoic acid export membrane protein
MELSRLFAANILWRGTYLFTSMLVTVLMARYLEASLTGWLMYFISLLTFIFMAVSLSLESALVYFSASGKINEEKLFTFSLFWILIALVAVSPFLIFFLKDSHNEAINVSFPVYGILFIAGNLLITYFSSFFYAKHQNKIPNLVFIFVNAGLIFFLIAGLRNTNDSELKGLFIRIYFVSFFLQGLVCMFLFAILRRSSFKFHFPGKTEVVTILRYALLALMANLLLFLLTRIDYWFIKNIVHDNNELGNYVQASRLVQLFQLLPVILASTIFPAVSSGLRTDMITVIQMLSRLLFWLYAIVILLVALTGKWLFPFVFGITFSKMYMVFLFLAPGLLATSVTALITAYLAAIDKVRYNMYGVAAGLIVIIPMDLIVIPSYGIYGAAVVSSVGYLIALVVAYYYLSKQASVSFLDFILIRKNDLKNLSAKYLNFSFK